MAVRLPSAALFGAALLAVAACHATGRAKPPDLPQLEKPVCAPQAPASPQAPQLTPWDLIGVPEGGQEESEVRAAADRHAAARRMTRCLLLGAHPLLPFTPLAGQIDDAVEEGLEDGPDACDPLMVSPATRLLFGGQSHEKTLTPAVEALLRWLGSLESRSNPVTPDNADGLYLVGFLDSGTVVAQAEPEVQIQINPPPPMEPVAAPSCPYLKEQQKSTAAQAPAAPAADLCTNLETLKQAEEVFRQAEAYRAFGQLARAKVCYEKVKAMAGGSRYDTLATERLQDVTALMKLTGDEVGSAEEQEPKGDAPRLKKKPGRRPAVVNRLAPRAEAPAPPSDVTCPYLKEQAAKKAAPPVEMPGDVLGNIRKLEEAQKAFDLGEFFRRSGNAASASFYYEMARKLAPGSRYDELAGVALKQVADARPQRPDAEEQEMPVPVSKAKAVRRPEPKPTTREMTDKRLEAAISVNYTDVPLSSVLDDFLAEGINITLDYPALESEGVNMYAPISLRLQQVSVKSALNLAVKQAGLACKIENDVIVVTTPAAARGKMIVRVYEVGDLLGKGKVLPASAKGAGAKECTPEMLVEFITSTVDPVSWDAMGGKGTVEYFPLGRSLVVNQTADAHEQIAGVLETLRRLNDGQKDSGGAEEQSTGGENGAAHRETERRVHELLEACQKAYLLGKYGEAEGLARQAIDADVESVHRHPVVKNFELFLKLSKAAREKKPRDREPAGLVPMRQPELPPVDPGIVPAMDRLLDDAGLQIEVQVPSCGEEQEVPAPPFSDVKELFIEPAGKCDCDGDCGPCEAIKKFLGTVGAAGCAEVDGKPGCSRGRCQVFLGSVSLRVSWEKDGHGSFTLELQAGEPSK